MAHQRKRVHVEIERSATSHIEIDNYDEPKPSRKKGRRKAAPKEIEFSMNNPLPVASSSTSTTTPGVTSQVSSKHISSPHIEGLVDTLGVAADVSQRPEDEDDSSIPAEPTKKNSNSYLQQWLTLSSHSYLNAEYDYDAPPRLPNCGNCQQSVSSFFRCVSCLGNAHYCQSCLVDAHRHNPTHRTETWSGSYWCDVPLARLGLILHLGHDGKPCSEKGSTTSILVGDLNGFTEVQVRYCNHINSSSKPEQLLSAGLFPCSDVAPRSAFTKVLLAVFNVFNTLGSTSAHRFYSVLERMTNPGFPEDVDDRYRELLSTYRKFLHITNLKRASEGFYSHPDEAHPGDQALDCLACPRPGLNFDWKEVSAEEEPWFRVHVSYDGNFRSVRKAKKVDTGDICFSDGKAYFSEKGRYQEWIQQPHAPQRTQKPTCDHHKAAQENSVRKAGRDVTGIGAFTCTSHSCFIPRGMVDFTGGEKFIFCDWSFAQIVRYMYGYGRVVLRMTYDIWCHWFINWLTRKFNLPSDLLVPEDLDFNGAIPKWHMIGHEIACHIRYALDFMQYVGRLEGEGPERVWAYMNQHAGSTSEQGPGSRTDSMNNMAYEFNFEKIIRFHTSLPPRFLEAKKMFIIQKTRYDDLTAKFTPHKIEEWKAESIEAKQNKNGKWDSPMFDSITNQGSYQTKIQEGRKNESPEARVAGRKPGATRWVSEGIELEHSVQRLKEDTKDLGSNPTPRRAENINTQRIALRYRITTHQNRRSFYMSNLDEPDHSNYVPLEDDDMDNIEIRLPSSYSPSTLKSAGLSTLAELELHQQNGILLGGPGNQLKALKGLKGPIRQVRV